MIAHQALVEETASRTRLDNTEDAVRVVRVIVAGIARRLPMPERRRLRAALPLSPDQLRARLSLHPDWRADGHSLVRAVALPTDRIPPLLDQVDQDARALNHAVRQREGPDGITFELYIHSINEITELDIQLADRIDPAITAVGSTRRPGRRQ